MKKSALEVMTILICLPMIVHLCALGGYAQFNARIVALKKKIATGMDYNQFNGLRCKVPNQPKIYLVGRGKRRWIPDPESYSNLFRDWIVYAALDVINIPEGKQLTHGAFLARCHGTATVFFIDNGQKRGVTSPAVMDKYGFGWEKIFYFVDNCILLDCIPTGPLIY